MSIFEQSEKELLKLQDEARKFDRDAAWEVNTGGYETFQQAVDSEVNMEEPKEWTEENIKVWLVKLRAEVIGYYERQLKDPKKKEFARYKLNKISQESDTELFWSNTNNFKDHFPGQYKRHMLTSPSENVIIREIDSILSDMGISNDEAGTFITQAHVGLSDSNITPELKEKYRSEEHTSE